MAKYISKPVEIEAWKIKEDNLSELAKLDKENILIVLEESFYTESREKMLSIKSATGWNDGRIGDYLCKNEVDYYPCPKEIFEQKYELVK